MLVEAVKYLHEYGRDSDERSGGMEHTLISLVEPILSCVARRMGAGADSVAEPSEELRVAELRLVMALVSDVDCVVLASVSDELTAILERGMHDAFHEAKKAACKCAVRAATTGVFMVHEPAGMPAKAVRLVKACVGGVLSHQHHRVRQAGIEALGVLVEMGGGRGRGSDDGVADRGRGGGNAKSPTSPVVLDEDVVPALAKLVQDRQAVVRRALCKVVSSWLIVDGLIGEEGRVALLSIVVSCLTDETADVVKDAKAEIEAIGSAWASCERARGTGLDGDCEMEDVGSSASGAADEGADGRGNGCGGGAHIALPAPYDDQPPGEDAQRMVGAALKNLLPGVLRGLQEWTVQLRTLHARQLKAVTLLAGKRCVPYLDTVLPALATAVGDDNAEVAELCIACAHVIASTCPARRWVELAVDCVDASIARSVGQQTSALTLVAALLYNSRPGSLGTEDVDAIATCIASEDVRGIADPNVRLQLLVVAQNLARTESTALRDPSISRKVFVALLQLIGEENDEVIRRDAQVAIARVAGRSRSDASAGDTGNDDADAVGELFAMHAPALLSETVASDADWVATSPQFQVFKQLLVGCPSRTVAELLPLALPSMYACAGENRDAALRMAVLKLIDTLAETKDSGAVTAPTSRALMELAMLAAAWCAGKTAAAVRYSAVVAMGTLVRRGLCVADVLRPMLTQAASAMDVEAATQALSPPPSLLPIVITCMDEDYYADTRRASCHLCEQVLCIAGQQALSDEQRRQLYPALLKRLDDSSDTVRIAACSVLSAFFSTLPAEYDDTNTGYLLKGMLLHMDDANAAVQEAVCLAALAAAAVKPGVVLAAAEEARRKHRSAVYIDRVVDACRPQPQS